MAEITNAEKNLRVLFIVIGAIIFILFLFAVFYPEQDKKTEPLIVTTFTYTPKAFTLNSEPEYFYLCVDDSRIHNQKFMLQIFQDGILQTTIPVKARRGFLLLNLNGIETFISGGQQVTRGFSEDVIYQIRLFNDRWDVNENVEYVRTPVFDSRIKDQLIFNLESLKLIHNPDISQISGDKIVNLGPIIYSSTPKIRDGTLLFPDWLTNMFDGQDFYYILVSGDQVQNGLIQSPIIPFVGESIDQFYLTFSTLVSESTA